MSYFYGSGQRFAAAIAGAPYGKPGTNRLNLTAAGGATNADRHSGDGDARQRRRHRHRAAGSTGNSTIASGETIPRNALVGLPLHKVDLRLTKDIKLVGTTKISLIGEVYNLFNHHNYGSYNSDAERHRRRRPPRSSASRTQNTGNAYVPRQAQFAFRLSF